jgi:hypothetical protein
MFAADGREKVTSEFSVKQHEYIRIFRMFLYAFQNYNITGYFGIKCHAHRSSRRESLSFD